jgi:Flp pilus assembly protein TadB
VPPSDRLPDKAEHQRRFAALEFSQRRQVVKAVNQGRALEDRKLAILAVGMARRQQRFWKWAWVIAPAVGAVQLWFVPVEQVLVNLLVATIGLALLAGFWYRKARRAETLNLAVVDRRAAGSHTPRAGRDDGDDPDDGDDDAAPAPAPQPRPPRPRGRKRR